MMLVTMMTMMRMRRRIVMMMNLGGWRTVTRTLRLADPRLFSALTIINTMMMRIKMMKIMMILMMMTMRVQRCQ